MREIAGTGRVRNGRLYVRDRARMEALLSKWGECEAIFTIEKAHATRSRAQNDYYHAVVVARIAAKIKRSAKETHEILKAQFLPTDRAQRGENGTLMNGLVIGGTTTKLNKLEFIDYLDAIVMWAAEKLDLFIPDPDPLWREHAEAEQQKGAA